MESPLELKKFNLQVYTVKQSWCITFLTDELNFPLGS